MNKSPATNLLSLSALINSKQNSTRSPSDPSGAESSIVENISACGSQFLTRSELMKLRRRRRDGEKSKPNFD